MQQASNEGPREYSTLCHSCVILKNYDLCDELALFHGDSMALFSRKTAVSLEKGLDQQQGESDGDGVTGDGTSSGSDGGKIELKLSAFMLQAAHASRDD